MLDDLPLFLKFNFQDWLALFAVRFEGVHCQDVVAKIFWWQAHLKYIRGQKSSESKYAKTLKLRGWVKKNVKEDRISISYNEAEVKLNLLWGKNPKMYTNTGFLNATLHSVKFARGISSPQFITAHLIFSHPCHFPSLWLDTDTGHSCNMLSTVGYQPAGVAICQTPSWLLRCWQLFSEKRWMASNVIN